MMLRAIVLAIFFVGASFASAEAAAGGIRRYALVAGANFGGKATADLRYAADDATNFRDVMVKFGGVAPDDSFLILNPDAAGLGNALGFLKSMVAKNGDEGKTVQVVFYYSGHSDERGLLLRGNYFDYADLRSSLAGIGADVVVSILDSCSSGSFARTKGGSFGPPFLIDEATSIMGSAVLTSSSTNEASQESDRIASSFFTYHLIGGLRGAADANGDGAVTLNEAYEYVYGRTLAETERTRGGAQHPAYSIDLQGKGNLILTDLRGGGARIVLDEGIEGKIALRDIKGSLVMETRKPAGKELAIGIDRGVFLVVLDDGGDVKEARLTVTEKVPYRLSRSSFASSKRSWGAAKGDGPEKWRLHPAGLRWADDGERTNVRLDLVGATSDGFDGLSAGLLYASTSFSSSGFMGSLFANVGKGDFSGYMGSLAAGVADGDFFGVQACLAYNRTAGNLRGLQAGVWNEVGANAAFGQVGVFNTVGGGGSYFQVGGLNRSSGSISGLQLGAVNIAKKSEGAQMGLVNIADEHGGVQLGLVNISKSLDGIPIGLFDFQANGENHVDLTFQTGASGWEDANNDVFVTTSLRLGSRYAYKYASVSALAAPSGSDGIYPSLGAGMGFGIRIPFFENRVALHLDGGAMFLNRGYTVDLDLGDDAAKSVVPKIRFFGSWKILGGSGIVAGVDGWLFTKHFHPEADHADGGGSLRIVTNAGILLFSPRFFFGFQL